MRHPAGAENRSGSALKEPAAWTGRGEQALETRIEDATIVWTCGAAVLHPNKIGKMRRSGLTIDRELRELDRTFPL